MVEPVNPTLAISKLIDDTPIDSPEPEKLNKFPSGVTVILFLTTKSFPPVNVNS